MVRRVVRDLISTENKTISLKREDAAEHFAVDADAIDCSVLGKKKSKVVRTARGGDFISDISVKKNSEEEQSEKVFYLHINAADTIKSIKISEVVRMAAAGLVILLVLNIINIYNRGMTLKNDVIATAYSGYQDLLSAGAEAGRSDFAGAEQTFIRASENFDLAMEEISFLKNHQNYFLTREKTVDSAQGLLDAAKNISLAGQNFSRGIENLRHLPELFIAENSNNAAFGNRSATGKSLTDTLKEDLAYIQTATEQINLARENLKNVSADVLPPGFREKLDLINNTTGQIYDLLTETQQKIPAVLEMLGDRYPHRYLILLQNDSEARPTGGFIGSYLIADLNDGYITKFEFHDVYELDGQFHEYIEPPADIALVSDTWRLRDSNYSPDFTISAEKSAWFLQKENGPSVDSVITVNLSFVEQMLELTGPLQISGLSAPLDKDSFQLVLSYIVESKLSGAESPKEIMREIVPAFQAALGSKVPLDQLITSIIKGFEEKKIMLYSRHENVQELFDELDLSNRIDRLEGKEDYLQVVATSIGGNKSDRFINQNISHYTLIKEDGTLVNELAVTRSHTWNGKDLQEWQRVLKDFGFNDLPAHIIDILGRGKNVVFMKVYVPKGSQLMDAYGVNKEDVVVLEDEELDKTYFMFRMEVSAMGTNKVSLTYLPPFKLEMHPADTYRFRAQNQPAYNSSFLEKKIYFKPGYKSYRTYPESLKTLEDGSLSYGSGFTSDLYLSALVGY